MSKIEFFKEFKSLCEYYNNKIYENKTTTAMYYEELKNINIETLKNKFKEIIKNNKFMPKISELKANSNFTQRIYSNEFLDKFYDN